ncbi:hypothetical protein JCM5353_008924 [Sporobolomyces roseus]
MLLHRLPARLPLHFSRFSRFLSTSNSTSSIPPLIGTAPYYPRHLIIHTPHPSKTWPSHLESTSELYETLSKRWNKLQGLKDLGFAFSESMTLGKAEKEWDPNRNRFQSPIESPSPESYTATLYPDFIPIPFPLSLATLPEFEKLYLSLPSPPTSPTSTSPAPQKQIDIYICTHGSRDCRCGELGEPLYQSILKEVRKRDLGERVKVRRISHIGGHKWAGNALVYREGSGCDWYGLLRDTDVKTLIDHATSPTSDPWYSQWRGRLNESTECVKSLYLSNTPSSTSKSTPRIELGEQIDLRFESYEGEEFKVKGFEGENLMQVAKRNDLPSIWATCGGNCECATCHVHIPPLTPPTSTSTTERVKASIPEEAPLPELEDEEDEQLDFALGADEDSRLACQIPVTKELGEWVARGGKIKLPRY